MSDVLSVLGGAGALGRDLVLRLARSGRAVVLGRRDATRAEVWVEAHVDGASRAEAAAAGGIVLLATPWDEGEASIAALASALGGRLVLCSNPLAFDAQGPHGLPVSESIAAELPQRSPAVRGWPSGRCGRRRYASRPPR